MYFTPIKCHFAWLRQETSLWTPSALLCPSLLREACHAAFHEIMLEISQQKQKSLIRFVKQGKGVMSTQMWEGVVHLCDLPAQDVPGASSPGYPSCCVGTESRLLAGSPVRQDHGDLLEGLEWQNPFLGRTPSCLCCTGSTAGTGMSNSFFKRSDLLCSFGVFSFPSNKNYISTPNEMKIQWISFSWISLNLGVISCA